MSKLKLELNKELDIMVELKISAEEWLFIQLLFLYEEGDTTSFVRYFVSAKKDHIPRDILLSLKEKGIIDKSYTVPEIGKEFDIYKLKLSPTFYKKYFKSSLEMGLELLDHYPIFITNGNKSFPMKNIAKSFRSLEDFSFMYAKAIKFNKEKHQEILELIDWAKENNLIQFNIAEFVISRKWDDLGKLKSGEVITNFVTTFDIAETI